MSDKGRIISKKSQITIFIIAGMFLLAGVGVTIYLMTSTQQFVETQTFRRTPTSFRDYIEICMEDTSSSAIRSIGFQGGYLEMPYFIRANDAAFISLGSRREFGIPSWLFRGEFRIPRISDMETEISGYVEDNIHSCLGKFDDFEDYNVTEREPINVSTTISDDNVLVRADYPIDVVAERASQVEFYEDFTAEIPVKLGKMHELGKRITHSEAWNNNFENSLFDLMSAHPDVPITEQAFSAKQLRWEVSDVRQTIDRIMFYNMPDVRFKGTDYPSFQLPESEYEKFGGYNLLDYREGDLPDDVPEDSYEYFNLFFDPNDVPSDYNLNTRMSFDEIRTMVNYYSDEYLDVNVKPSSGGVMSTNMMELPDLGIPFPIQLGHFSYDIDLLLEINMLDPDAMFGEGFMMRFALPVSLRDNVPDKDTTSFTLDSEPTQFDSMCDDMSGDYEVNVVGLVGTVERQPLRDADVSYDCIQFGCRLGETRAEGGTYKLTTGFPSSCSGGFINVEKEGYLPAQKQYTGESESITVELKKIEDFDVDVVKRPVYAQGSGNVGQAQSLSEGESVVGVLEPHEHGEDLVFEFAPGEDIPELEMLVHDAGYDLDLLLLDDDSNIIGGFKGEFTYNIMDSAGRDEVQFSVVEYLPTPIPLKDPENMVEIMTFIEEGDYQEQAAPRFN